MNDFKRLEGKKIALIGGAGFVGHNLALHLQSLGAKVDIIDGMQVNNLLSLVDNVDNLPYPDLSRAIINERTQLLKSAQINLRVQDARDYHALTRLLNEIKPNIIIQLAAVSHANRSNKDPYSTFDHSFRTLENSLDWSRGGTSNVEQFIFFSSSMVYGNFESDQVDEDTNCEPLGIYGALKYGSEKIIIGYNQTFGLPYTIIRPSALYGERCISRRVGQIFIESALHKKEIFIDGDGEEKLDFTYIEDLINGIGLCCSNKDAINQTFNLTYGKSKKINKLIEILKNEFPNIKIFYKEKEKFMPERGTLDISKAKKLIGYNPINPIDTGYIKYISWYKKFWDHLKRD